MEDMSVKTVSFGGGFMNLLFLVFLVLKLTNVIDWSWWWVTAPLWGPLALVLVILAIFMAILAWCGAHGR